MTENLLIDLGGTLIINDKFSLRDGLSYLYDNYRFISYNPPTKEQFISIGYRLFSELNNKRKKTSREISLVKYLKLLQDRSRILFTKKAVLLEEELYNIMVKDLFNQDAYDFLIYCMAHHIKVWCFSNSMFSKKTLLTTLEKFGLTPYISGFYSSCDLKWRKPSKRFFQKAKLNFKLDEKMLFVGNDIEVDGKFAEALKIKFAYYAKDEIKPHNAAICFKKYQELEEYLENEN